MNHSIAYKITDQDLLLDAEDKKYVLRIKDLPDTEKPREKLIHSGPDALSANELLAVVLNVGTTKEGVLAMSKRLLKEYGEKTFVDQKDPAKIAKMLNIPIIKACQIVACFELGRRFFKTSSYGKPIFIRTAKQVHEYLKEMRDLKKEQLRGLYLNSHYNLVHEEIISIGSVTSNVVHPREVFRPGLEHFASAVILAHNHPSGITTPSQADIDITKQLVEAGKILGIHLVDHLIIAGDKFASIKVDYE